MKNILLLLFLFSTEIFSQKLSEKDIFKKVQDNIDKVEDFSANLIVTVDMERIKVPKMDVGLYFKKPDKYSIKSKNFAMIPKEALGFNILSILKDYQIKSLEKIKTDSGSFYNMLYERNTYIETRPLNIKLLINAETFTIDEVYSQQANLKRSATVSFKYQIFENNLYLPVETTAKFDFETGEEEKPKQGVIRNPRKGIVQIKYQNYQINKGLNDSLFVEKK
ncbi:MAG: hypothetical protein AAB255_00145 [Bacteroidota bacterium]